MYVLVRYDGDAILNVVGPFDTWDDAANYGVRTEAVGPWTIHEVVLPAED